MKVISTLRDLNTVDKEIEFNNFEDLKPIITLANWCPGTFKNGHRKSVNMQTMDLFAIDIDKGLSLEDAIDRCKVFDLSCLIGTTKSHKKEKKGTVADRYRILFKLSKSITHRKEIKPIFEQLRFYFPQVDESCKDAARLFYPCKEIVYLKEEGIYLEPSIRFPLSPKTWILLQKGADPGSRNEPFVAAAHDVIQQKWTYEEYEALLKRTSHPWLYSEEYLLKLQERYKNFNPAHAPRTLPSVATPTSSSSPQQQQGRAERLPLNQVRGFLEGWLKLHEVAVSYNRSLHIQGKQYITADIVRKVILSLSELNLGVDEKLIEYNLLEWVEERRVSALENVKETINGFDEGRGSAECKKFLSVLKADTTELDVAVFKHMLWQVKRKLNGERTKYEMMFVMTGGQGTGKSTALRDYLFQPLGDLAYSGADFRILSDERENRLFSDHYIIMFDEMSGAQKSDMERTKQVITSGVVKQRRMGTTSHDTLAVNATFFGTANAPLETLIKDSSGMRRFYEFTVDSVKETSARWGELPKLDLVKIWEAVDYNSEVSPIEDLLAELNVKQEAMRDRGLVEWMLEEGYVEKVEDKRRFTTAVVLTYAVNVITNQSWSAKSLSNEWKKAKIAKDRHETGIKYGLRVIDPSVLNLVERKYGITLSKGEF